MRIQAEFVEGFGLLAELGPAVTVFGSARTRPGSREYELAEHCRGKLPSFMVPRYLEFVDALPRTPTDKIAKHELRAVGRRGLTETTWDREQQRFVLLDAAVPPGPQLPAQRPNGVAAAQAGIRTGNQTVGDPA